jgi:restriction system protein
MAATTTRRRPTRRPTRRSTQRPANRRRTRRQQRRDLLAVALVLAVFAVIGVARWITRHPGISVAVAAAGVAVAAWAAGRVVRRRFRAHRARWAVPTRIESYMNADPNQFEWQTAALCRRDGCTRVRVVGGAGDLAADVLATTPDGRRILIQCKRYARGNTVGSDHVQRVNGTYRDIHHCQKAIIVTTSHYTTDAIRLAGRVGITLIDADGLAHWARGGPAPWN